MPTALVVGASRGIGLEFVRQCRADGWRVIATARDSAGLGRLQALGVETLEFDADDEQAAARLAKPLAEERLDIALLNAGVYGPRSDGIEPPTRAQFDQVMRTNVHATMQLTPIIAPRVAAAKGRFAVMSSRMGSIGGRSGVYGWLYRASKAALNSVLKDISLEYGGKGAICVALHPGWVRTEMGGAGATLEPKDSVAGLRRTLARLTLAENGGFYSYDGARLEW